RTDVERAVDDELQFHFELTVRDLMAKGLSESDARTQAEARFGDVERTRNGLREIDRARVKESRRIEWWSNAAQDFGYALRGMRRKPGFAIAVVVILALGIGANATMFGIVDQLLLRPPAHLANADRVQRLYMTTFDNNKEYFGSSTSYHRFRDLTDSAKTIEAAAAVWNPSMAIGTEGAQEHRITYASAGFWKLFDVRPVIGRFYSADEDVPGRSVNVVVLNYGFWQSAYGGQSDVLGKIVRIGRFDYSIIGVAPSGFTGLSRQTPAAFIPLASGGDNSFPGNGKTHWYETYGLSWVQVVVRRKPDATLIATTTEMGAAFRRSYDAARAINPASATPPNIAKPRVVVAPIQSERGPNQSTDVKVAVWLVGVALIVLIVACANVINLMLARALRRQREIAVRLALGISRQRLLAQLLVESTMLALLGGVAGLLVTEWGGRILRATLLPDVSWVNTLSDTRTLLFTITVAVVVGVLTGLLPALRSGKTSLASALKAGSREGTHQRSRLRSTLMVMQAALSVVLLVGAGLFVRSLRNVQSTRLGFDADRIVLVEQNLRGVQLDSTRQQVVLDEMLRTAQAIPGVQNAAAGAMIPFMSEWDEELFVAGIDSASKRGHFLIQVTSPDYFATMGTRIVRGRGFSAEDQSGTEPVMVVSQSMANALWPNADALTKCVRIKADTMPCRRVIGIAEDVHWEHLTGSRESQLYLPKTQFDIGRAVLFVRLKAPMVNATETIRAAVQRAMPGTAYVTTQPMSDVLDEQFRSWQLGATMFALFGGLALVVASIGLYSVISYSVAQRTQEMGVRLALGARSVDVVRMVLRQSVSLSLFAVALGVGVSLFAGRWIKPLLFETSAYDPTVYGGVTAALIVVAVVAALAPALRASRVDPVEALREQ
ncbi:MAG: ABC transporter permease, partial [Gemmatimonadaceae bacterium]